MARDKENALSGLIVGTNSSKPPENFARYTCYNAEANEIM